MMMKHMNRLVVAGLLMSFGWGLSAQAANAPAGTIKLIKGDVQVMDAKSVVVGDSAGKTKRPLAVGTPFYIGETIVTKGDGRVKIEFVEGKNEVVLGTNTSLLIERASTDPLKATGTTLSLARGEVRSSVNHKYSGKGGDAYEVKTPNAVAGVRGTVFLARFSPSSMKSEIATERGLVSVKNIAGGVAGKEVMVKPGMFTASVGSAPASAPAPLSSNKDLEGAVKSLGSGSSDSEGGSDKVKAGDSTADNKDGKSSDKDAKSSDSKDSKTADSKSDSKSDTKADSKTDSKTADSGSSSDTKADSKSTAASGDTKSDSKSGSTASSSGDSKSSSAAGGKSDVAAGGSSSSNSSSGSSSGGVPLGREPVAASPDGGRSPASVGGNSPSGVNAVAGVSNSAPKPAFQGPPPTAAAAVQAVSQTVNTVNTVNQTVNQQTQQAQRTTGTAKIAIK